MAKDTTQPDRRERAKWVRRAVLVAAAAGLAAGVVVLARPKPTAVEAARATRGEARGHPRRGGAHPGARPLRHLVHGNGQRAAAGASPGRRGRGRIRGGPHPPGGPGAARRALPHRRRGAGPPGRRGAPPGALGGRPGARRRGLRPHRGRPSAPAGRLRRGARARPDAGGLSQHSRRRRGGVGAVRGARRGVRARQRPGAALPRHATSGRRATRSPCALRFARGCCGCSSPPAEW